MHLGGVPLKIGNRVSYTWNIREKKWLTYKAKCVKFEKIFCIIIL